MSSNQHEAIRKGVMVLNPIMYRSLQAPEGFLVTHPACHALWHYYVVAANNLDTEKNQVVYEGDADPKYNYHQLFSSIAKLYGVEPEQMTHYWQNVDTQAAVMGFPKMPEGYRFNKALKLKGH